LKIHAKLLPRNVIVWRFAFQFNGSLKIHAKLLPRIVIGQRFAC